MNLMTIEHAALVLGTEPYIIDKLVRKGLIRSYQVGDLYRVDEFTVNDLVEYPIFIRSEEALS